MLRIKTYWHVVGGAMAVSATAVVAAAFHVTLFYPPEMQPIVLPKALSASAVVGFLIALVVMRQLMLNYLLSEQLQRLLDRDRLTDAATRDFFFARMSKAQDTSGVSLMVDIDHFKRVNDTYGHLAGDRVIAEVARVLRETVRQTDIVCRFGGEEFVIFLESHNGDEGFAAAERIRCAIADRRMTVGNLSLSVTVSIGAACKQPLDDVTRSILVADAALYQAKEMGRNRTVFSTDPSQPRACWPETA